MASLAVTRLRLSHFRSYRLADLDVGGGPVAIHGANGAGKTNLLEAVSLLSPGRGLRRARAEEFARTPEGIGWRITATVSGRAGHEVVTGAEPGRRRSVDIDGKAASQLALARLMRIVWLVPAMDRLWTEGAADRRQFLDRMTMSLDPGHADAVLGYERAMRERNRLLKEGRGDGSWYTALEAQMAEFGAAMIAGRTATIARITAAQDGAETGFPAADLSVVPAEGDEAVTAEELAAAFLHGRRADMGAGRTLKGPHRADLSAVYAEKGMAARLCSTGEQKALLVSLILANARAIASDFGAPPVLLLDEVAAHLDAGRRAMLFDEIVAMGAQAWMTGTGPELFADLGDRASYLAVRDDGTGSAIAPGQAGRA